jgi:two-component system response regulator MprA
MRRGYATSVLMARVPVVRVLVVEDDPMVASALTRGLALEGYTVDTAEDGPIAMRVAAEHPPDVAVLDVTLPGMDGMEVSARLRHAAVTPYPILLLTDRDATVQAVDDQLVKPFAFEELLTRVRALLRRGSAPDGELLEFGGVTLSPSTRRAWRDGVALLLGRREFDLLELFLRHPDGVLTRASLLEQVWDYGHLGGVNVVDACVRSLREKLEANGHPRLIQTVRLAGYALRSVSE